MNKKSSAAAPDRVLFKGKSLNLIAACRRLPAGRLAQLEMIEHPGAALIVPFFKKDVVIMLRQYRPVLGVYLYEFPAGTLNRREPPGVCAVRELIEETGFAAQRLKKIGMIYPVPGYSTEKIFIYRAEQLKKQTGKQDDDEIIKVCFLKRKEVRRLAKQGKFKDAKTLSALALLGWL